MMKEWFRDYGLKILGVFGMFGLFVLLAHAGMGETPAEVEPDVQKNTARVFIYDKNSYGFLVGADRMAIELYDSRDVQYLADVPTDQPMRFLCRNPRPGCCGETYCRAGLEVHIHLPTDIVGAGYDHGKHGHGVINTIE